jgi:hypothetical protein
MVLEGNGNGVREERIWCYSVPETELESNGYSVKDNRYGVRE